VKKEEVWIKVQNPKAGDEVKLVAYKKARGDNHLEEGKRKYIGGMAIIEMTEPVSTDKSGCRISRVAIEGSFIFWRVSSMRKHPTIIGKIKEVAM